MKRVVRGVGVRKERTAAVQDMSYSSDYVLSESYSDYEFWGRMPVSVGNVRKIRNYTMDNLALSRFNPSSDPDTCNRIMILPTQESGVLSDDFRTAGNTPIASLIRSVSQNENGGYDYYFKFTYVTEGTNKIPLFGLGLIIPTQSDVTRNSAILGKYSNRVNQITSYFQPGDAIYIFETEFPYCVQVWDNQDVDVYFVNCTFSTTFQAVTAGPPKPYGADQWEQDARQDYLVNLSKTPTTARGGYTFIGTTNFNLPSVGNKSFLPINAGGVSDITNLGQFVINVAFDSNNGQANTIVNIGLIDGATYTDATSPKIVLSGEGTLRINSPVDTSVTVQNNSSANVTIQNTNFSKGLVLDLTANTGVINLDNCKIFTPTLGPNNVYALTTVGSQNRVAFTGNSSVLWTGYGASYPWLAVDESNNTLDSSNLRSVVTWSSANKVNMVLSKGQDYSFAGVPYHAQTANVILADTTAPYTLTNLRGNPNVRPLTNAEEFFRKATSDKGYEKSFGQKLRAASSQVSVVVNNLVAQRGARLYSSNSNVTVHQFELTSESFHDTYLLEILGNSAVNFTAGNSYVLNLKNGRNFWNNQGVVVLAGSTQDDSQVRLTYNLWGNANTYVWTSDKEYQGPGSVYSKTVNLVSNATEYRFRTDKLLTVNPTASNLSVVDSTVNNGLVLTSVNGQRTVVVGNSTVSNRTGVVVGNTSVPDFNPGSSSQNGYVFTNTDSTRTDSYKWWYNYGQVFRVTDQYNAQTGLYSPTNNTLQTAGVVNYTRNSTTQTANGWWFQVQVPVAAQPSSFSVRRPQDDEFATNFVVLGSSNGTTWEFLGEYNNLEWPTNRVSNGYVYGGRGHGSDVSVPLAATTAYSYFRVVVTKIGVGRTGLNLHGAQFVADLFRYNGDLLDVQGSNTRVQLGSDNTLNVAPTQFVTSNVEAVSVVPSAINTFNLTSTSSTADYSVRTGSRTRKLEKENGVVLVSNNCQYNLSNVVNDASGTNVTFGVKVGTQNASLVDTSFPNQVAVDLAGNTLVVNNCTLERQGAQNSVLNFVGSTGTANVRNSTLTASQGSALFTNYEQVNLSDSNTVYRLRAHSSTYDLNSEPTFVAAARLTGTPNVNVGTDGNKLSRTVTFTGTENNQRLHLQAEKKQVVTNNGSNELSVSGFVVSTAEDDYALVLNGSGKNHVKDADLTVRAGAGRNGDLIYVEGLGKKLVVEGSRLVLPASHRVSLTSGVTGTGNIDLGSTNTSNSDYDTYVYWPNLADSTATTPFTSANGYWAVSWLPNNTPRAFVKNQDEELKGFNVLQEGDATGPASSLVSRNRTYYFAVAPGVNTDLTANIVFYGAPNLLPSVSDDQVDELFTEEVVELGVVGYLNNKQKTVDQSGLRLYKFEFGLDNDQQNNFYVGNLGGAVKLWGNMQKVAWQYSLEEVPTYQPSFGLDLRKDTTSADLVGPSANVDVYNGSAVRLNYFVTTNGDRPVVLDGYVYLQDENGEIPVPDVTAAYVGGNPASMSVQGLSLTGTGLTVNNVGGILPNHTWTVDCKVKPTTNGAFTVFETVGDDRVAVYANKSNATVEANVHVNGEELISNTTVTAVDNFYHLALFYVPDLTSRNGTLTLVDVNSNGNPYSQGTPEPNITPNVDVSTLIFGTGLTGTLKQTRVSYVDLDVDELSVEGLDESNTMPTVFYNSLQAASGTAFSAVETPIFSSALVGNVVVATPEGPYPTYANGYYTYPRPRYVFGKTLNVATANLSVQNLTKTTFAKGDTRADDFWEQQVIRTGVYFFKQVEGVTGSPVASNVVTLVNTQPNYLYPLARFGRVENDSFWLESSAQMLLQPGDNDYNDITFLESYYTRDFYITVKMANLPDSGVGNVYVYGSEVQSNDISFSFYDADDTSSNVMVQVPGNLVNNQTVYAAKATFRRTTQQGYINRDNKKTFFVRARTLRGNKKVGLEYPANIVLLPDFDVESYTSGSLAFGLNNVLIPTVQSQATYMFGVPYVIKLGVNDDNSGSPRDTTLQPVITSSTNLTKNRPHYFYAELFSGVSDDDVVVSVSVSQGRDSTVVRQPYQVTDTSTNVVYFRDNYESADYSDYNADIFQFNIPAGATTATNVAKLEVLRDDKTWGNSTFTVGVANLFADTQANTFTQAAILQPYVEVDRRAFRVHGTGSDNKTLEEQVVYRDRNIQSSELKTSVYSNTTVNTKQNILSKQLRQGMSLTFDSVPHFVDESNANVRAVLSFQLVNPSNVANISTITSNVKLYTSVQPGASEIVNKSISVVPENWNSNVNNQVYLDFSGVNFKSYADLNQRLVRVYANLVPEVNGTAFYNTDYSGLIGNTNILVWQLDFSNCGVDVDSAKDSLVIGNWRFITGTDGQLLLQFKNTSVDSQWQTKVQFDDDGSTLLSN